MQVKILTDYQVQLLTPYKIYRSAHSLMPIANLLPRSKYQVTFLYLKLGMRWSDVY